MKDLKTAPTFLLGVKGAMLVFCKLHMSPFTMIPEHLRRQGLIPVTYHVSAGGVYAEKV